MNFEERLERLRKDRDLTQRQLAEMTGEKETINLNQKEKHVLETFQKADPKMREAILHILAVPNGAKLNIDVRALLSLVTDSIDE